MTIIPINDGKTNDNDDNDNSKNNINDNNQKHFKSRPQLIKETACNLHQSA